MTRPEGVRRHHRQARRGRRPRARQGRRPRRARRRELHLRAALQRARGHRLRHHAAADGQRALRRTATRRPSSQRLAKRFPPGMKYELAFDNTIIVTESIREVLITLLEAIGLVILVMFLFLQDWRATRHPDHHDPRLAHRHLRLRAAPQLLDQHADAVRDHPRHGPRRRRRDRRRRERAAAPPRVREERARGRVGGDGRGGRPRHRDRARAGRRVRAGRAVPGHDRAALPAVRADDRLLGRSSPPSTR